MSETVYERIRNSFEAEPEVPFDPKNGDTWEAALCLFRNIYKHLCVIDSRFIPLEARRAAAHGRDGVGILDASIDAAGCLILEFSDGSQKNVGCVVGRDAPPAPPPQSLEFQRDAAGRVVRSVLR
jgi:hypothetical protein